jgi:phosphatidate cytidylyltransferase
MLNRWISALCGLALLFGALYFFGPMGLVVISSIIILVAAFEYAGLFDATNLWLWIFLSFNSLVYTTQLLFPAWALAVLVFSFVNLAAFGILLFRNLPPHQILAKIQWTLWGVVYTGLFPALGVSLLLTKGPHPLLFLLVTVFIGDTFALFAGKYFGDTKLFPNISPKKTIAGGIGGLAGSAVSGAVYIYCVKPEANTLLALFLSLGLGFFAQFGDFFESLIKRVSGKKDASQLMPGHGGFLDRLDGVYFASALLYFFFTIAGSHSFF